MPLFNDHIILQQQIGKLHFTTEKTQ
jgi:hypothetical protein